jgi:hypothetical protein
LSSASQLVNGGRKEKKWVSEWLIG